VTTLFNTIDEDNSGTVELEELAEACRRLGLGLSCPRPPGAVKRSLTFLSVFL
jgi:hypothetical protein